MNLNFKGASANRLALNTTCIIQTTSPLLLCPICMYMLSKQQAQSGAVKTNMISCWLFCNRIQSFYEICYWCNHTLLILKLSLSVFAAFTLVEYTDATWVRYMWWVYLIGLVWTSEFILACQQMVIAGAVARWYFHKWAAFYFCIA